MFKEQVFEEREVPDPTGVALCSLCRAEARNGRLRIALLARLTLIRLNFAEVFESSPNNIDLFTSSFSCGWIVGAFGTSSSSNFLYVAASTCS